MSLSQLLEKVEQKFDSKPIEDFNWDAKGVRLKTYRSAP
jgi:hypothetical protein